MVERKILVLFAHPTPDRSVSNTPLFRAAQKMPFVTAVDLYAEYPNHHIDIEREQLRLLQHDVVIFQFPMFWYSTPALLKEWQDLVLEYGFAYGSEGTALTGKKFLCSTTAGGSAESYSPEGHNRFTMGEFLRPLEQMAALTGMKYLPPLVLFSSGTAHQDTRGSDHLRTWKLLLKKLHTCEIDYQCVAPNQLMQDSIPAIFKASEAAK